jgi:hypothetical protein
MLISLLADLVVQEYPGDCGNANMAAHVPPLLTDLIDVYVYPILDVRGRRWRIEFDLLNGDGDFIWEVNLSFE